ncbi:MAG TPA: hypothetical protein VH436_28040 [Vicinamibacterales bacterium]|jgi:hypothetical protein
MRLVTRALVVLAAMLMTGCDEKLSDVTGPTPNLEPTFSSIQQNIFEASDSSGRLACTQCHNAIGSLFTGLNLTHAVAYTNLVNVAVREKAGATRVIPGDPENSYLIHKLEGRQGIVGARMPFNSPAYLTDGQILVIKRWIELGAKND